ncbi:MAG: hypothetical protein JW839_06055 [Candidatus Lokiarchaeota archaeon]|nr:hypothetical protein [Candidatus Lokiarchaeota archaeon]
MNDIIDDLSLHDDLKDTFILFFSPIGLNDLYSRYGTPAFSFTSMKDVEREYIDGEGFCPCDADSFDELKEGFMKFHQNRYANVMRKIRRANKSRLIIMDAHFFPTVNMAANGDLVDFFRALGVLHDAGRIKEILLISNMAPKVQMRTKAYLTVLEDSKLRIDEEKIIDLDQQVLEIATVRSALSRLKRKNTVSFHMQDLRQELCVVWRTPRDWRLQRLVTDLIHAGELERTREKEVFKFVPVAEDRILVVLASLKMNGHTNVSIDEVHAECKAKGFRVEKDRIGNLLVRLAAEGRIMHVPEENVFLLF